MDNACCQSHYIFVKGCIFRCDASDNHLVADHKVLTINVEPGWFNIPAATWALAFCLVSACLIVIIIQILRPTPSLVRSTLVGWLLGATPLLCGLALASTTLILPTGRSCLICTDRSSPASKDVGVSLLQLLKHFGTVLRCC